MAPKSQIDLLHVVAQRSRAQFDCRARLKHASSEPRLAKLKRYCPEFGNCQWRKLIKILCTSSVCPHFEVFYYFLRHVSRKTTKQQNMEWGKRQPTTRHLEIKLKKSGFSSIIEVHFRLSDQCYAALMPYSQHYPLILRCFYPQKREAKPVKQLQQLHRR